MAQVGPSLALDGTLGFRSMSLALMAATWAGYHLLPSIAFIAAHSLSSFNLFPSLRLFFSFAPLPLSFFPSLSFSLFFSTLFIYSFGPAAALCPLARRPVGCPLGRCSFEYFCSRNSNVRRRPVQASIQ